LAPGGICVLATSHYKVIAADLDAAKINNICAADSYPVSDTEQVLLLSPSLCIDKVYTGTFSDPDGSGDVSVGDTLTNTITTTNNETAILTNVVDSDNLTGARHEIQQRKPAPIIPLTMSSSSPFFFILELPRDS
jgi:hypothetical protein